MLKCIIIDDEPLAIQLLSDYAHQSQDLELLGAFTNPIEGLHALNELDVDLIFLDLGLYRANIQKNLSSAIFFR